MAIAFCMRATPDPERREAIVRMARDTIVLAEAEPALVLDS
jgi:hypothetical protein